MECLTRNEHLFVHLIICSFIKRGCAYFDTPSFTNLLTFYSQIGPCPIQLVVPIAVRNAVSAATIIFTASSTILCFFILYLLSAL